MKSFLTFVLFLSLSVFTSTASAFDWNHEYSYPAVYERNPEAFRSSLVLADNSLYIHTCVYVVKVFDSRTMYSFEFVSRQKLSTDEVLSQVLDMLGETTKIIKVMIPSCSIE